MRGQHEMKAGENYDVSDHVGEMLVARNQAEKVAAVKKEVKEVAEKPKKKVKSTKDIKQ